MGHIQYNAGSKQFLSQILNQDITISVKITVDICKYCILGGTKNLDRIVERRVRVKADTGATTCCTPLREAGNLGIRIEDTINSSLNLFVADRRRLHVKGCISVIIQGNKRDGQ